MQRRRKLFVQFLLSTWGSSPSFSVVSFSTSCSLSSFRARVFLLSLCHKNKACPRDFQCCFDTTTGCTGRNVKRNAESRRNTATQTSLISSCFCQLKTQSSYPVPVPHLLANCSCSTLHDVLAVQSVATTTMHCPRPSQC